MNGAVTDTSRLDAKMARMQKASLIAFGRCAAVGADRFYKEVDKMTQGPAAKSPEDRTGVNEIPVRRVSTKFARSNTLKNTGIMSWVVGFNKSIAKHAIWVIKGTKKMKARNLHLIAKRKIEPLIKSIYRPILLAEYKREGLK